MFCFPFILDFSFSTFLPLLYSLALTLAQLGNYYFSMGSHVTVTALYECSTWTFKAFYYLAFSLELCFFVWLHLKAFFYLNAFSAILEP